MKRLVAACGCVLCLYLFNPSPAVAQCRSGDVDLESLLVQPAVAMVFTGTVAGVARSGATEAVAFDVDRVWKGPVPSRMTIYRPTAGTTGHPESDPIAFDHGRRYVVAAHRLGAAERSNLHLADSAEAFGTDSCGDQSRPFTIPWPDLRRLGPGRAPVDQQPLVRGVHVAQPLKIQDAAPVYPKEARDAGVRGAVIVEFMVDETGRVGEVRVLRSIPLLDQAAVDCVMKWEYLPALVAGAPRRVRLTAAVDFER